MHLLTVDCGNSRTHFALIDLDRVPPIAGGGSLDSPATAAWPGLGDALLDDFAALNADGRDGVEMAWQTARQQDGSPLPAPDAVLIGTVNPLPANTVADWAHTRPDPPQVYRLREQLPIPIANRYRRPEQVGEDRLLNALACRLRFPGQPVIAVDFGSAITFDIVSADGAYLGGVITPGLNLALRALHERTALLPLVELPHQRPPLIGTDTESSILSGVYHGYPGLVLSLLDRLTAELTSRYGAPPRVVATGGDGAALADELPAGTFEAILPALTHEGLTIAWLMANASSS